MIDFDRLEKLLENVILEGKADREADRKAREAERKEDRAERKEDRAERNEDRAERNKADREYERLRKEVKEELKKLSIHVNGFIGAEGKSIEEEVDKKVPKYLKRKFSNCNIYKVHDDWQHLQKNQIDEIKNIKNRHEKSITEFDGLYIVSNDVNYEIGSPLVHQGAKINTNTSSKQYIFVVVEAKYNLNTTKVNTKIAQIKTFQEYIAQSVNSEENIYTKEFKDKVYLYQLPLFINQPIYLIFASPHMDSHCIENIKNEASSLMDNGISTAYMIPTGNRYSISFADEDFEPYRNVNTNTISIGKNNAVGGKKK
jgi:hypothetical protein